MQSPISWPGSKRLLTKHIIPKLPEHRLYVEVFGGSLAVLLAKERSRHEVVNDLNGDLVGFFRCVQFHREALLEELRYVLNSRAAFEGFVAQPGLTDLQRAARWFVRNKISFGAKGGHYGTSKKGGGAAFGSRAARLAAIDALNERLDRVNVEALDWRDLLEKYDTPDACFFVDPPYTSGMQYDGLRWGREDHVELRERLLALQGRWVLTYDDSELVRGLYEGCAIEGIERANGIGNNHGRTGRRYREVVVTPQLVGTP